MSSGSPGARRVVAPTSGVHVRAGVEQLRAYSSGRVGSAGDARYAGKALLASNELPFAPLAPVLEAIGQAASAANRYPDPAASELCEALAAMHGVEPDAIAVGAGSAEVARQALFSVCGPGDEVVIPHPSFAEYHAITVLTGARPVLVPLREEALDLDALAAAVTPATRALVVCNPNNPTGTARPATQIRALVERLPRDVLVILDEAYAEFADPSVICGPSLAAAHPNVVVLRTFSKAYGLAGLRVGYGVGAPELVELLGRIRVPFGLGALGQAGAIAALAERGEIERRVAVVVEERRRLVGELAGLGCPVPEPEGNFVWLRLGDAAEIVERDLAEAGVLVRPFDGALRVTVGLPEENDRLLEVLASVTAADAVHGASPR